MTLPQTLIVIVREGIWRGGGLGGLRRKKASQKGMSKYTILLSVVSQLFPVVSKLLPLVSRLIPVVSRLIPVVSRLIPVK